MASCHALVNNARDLAEGARREPPRHALHQRAPTGRPCLNVNFFATIGWPRLKDELVAAQGTIIKRSPRSPARASILRR